MPSTVLQAQITLKVINGLYQGVTTVELDNLAAETAATMTTKHPDYAHLAARVAVSNLHKETKKVFSGKLSRTGLEAIENVNPVDNCKSNIVGNSYELHSLSTVCCRFTLILPMYSVFSICRCTLEIYQFAFE